MKRYIVIICIFCVSVLLSATVLASAQIKRRAYNGIEPVVAEVSPAATQQQNIVVTTDVPNTLPESYYNSLKPLPSDTTAPSADPETEVVEEATSPPQPTINVVKTQDTPVVQRVQPEAVAPVAEPASSSIPEPVTEEKKPKQRREHSFQSNQYNTSYILTEIGNLRQELAEMRTGKGEGKSSGYDGGFFIQSEDGKFKIIFSGRLQFKYSFILAEDLEDGHTFNLRRLYFNIDGNAFSEKFTYNITLSPASSTSLYTFAIGYAFHPAFIVNATKQPGGISNIVLSSGGLMFISVPLTAFRFDYGDAVGLETTGEIGWFSYKLSVANGQALAYKENTNTEMFYTSRFDFNVLGKMDSAQGDIAYSESPIFTFGFGVAFGHMDDGTQARVLGGAGDTRFKYKGFSLIVGGNYRQVDPDQFTRAQTDVGATVMASYFVIPKKLEIALRGDALLDDITDAGVNLMMDGANDDGFFAPNVATLSGGDIDGDSANEYAGTLCMGYYFAGKNAKIQAEYTFNLDGIVGPDDRVYHVGQVQVQLGF
ncbi:MAG TPA: hypothetical protein VJC18_06505 [bacterium]|nr:hypothetical protein [bacterium]